MKDFIKEFKEFAMKGNVIDMAVGVVIGGAFGKIVSSLVSDVIMPLVGLLTGGVDFTTLSIQLGNPTNGAQANLKYGLFLQNLVDFLIIALSIFVFVKLLTKIKDKTISKQDKLAAEDLANEKKIKADTGDTVELLTEIRDLLAGKKPTAKKPVAKAKRKK